MSYVAAREAGCVGRRGKRFCRCRDLRKMQPAERRCGEMADATDLKSVGLLKARAGSSPAIGTYEKACFDYYINEIAGPSPICSFSPWVHLIVTKLPISRSR